MSERFFGVNRKTFSIDCSRFFCYFSFASFIISYASQFNSVNIHINEIFDAQVIYVIRNGIDMIFKNFKLIATAITAKENMSITFASSFVCFPSIYESTKLAFGWYYRLHTPPYILIDWNCCCCCRHRWHYWCPYIECDVRLTITCPVQRNNIYWNRNSSICQNE